MIVICPRCGRRFGISNRQVLTVVCYACRASFVPYTHQETFRLIPQLGPKESPQQYRRRRREGAGVFQRLSRFLFGD